MKQTKKANDMYNAIKLIKDGERTRVLFDMLAEHIGIRTEDTGTTFFKLVGKYIDKEREGYEIQNILTQEAIEKSKKGAGEPAPEDNEK